MPRALHILDAAAPADLMMQLTLLVGPSDAVISIGPPPACVDPDLPVEPTHRLFGSSGASGWRLRGRAAAFDVIHAWSPEAVRASEAAVCGAEIPRVASVAWVPPRPQLRRLVTATHSAALTVAVPTRACRQSLLDAGARDGAVHVLPPPARDITERAARRTRARRDLGLDDDKFLLLASTEMRRGGGHKYASWAHAVVRQVHPEIRLLCPGGGPIADAVHFFAQTTSYGDEAFFTGRRLLPADALAAADLATFFHERDVGAAPLAAAMAAGVPVVATDTPDLLECTDGGRVARLIPRGDLREAFVARGASTAVLELIENPDAAAALADEARAHAQTAFSVDACRARLAEIHAAART